MLNQGDLDSLMSKTTPFLAGKNIGGIISDLLPYIFALAGIYFLIQIISAGFSFLSSSGDPKKIEMAKGKITSSLIGLFIVIFAFLLVQLVGRILGLEDFMQIFG